MQLVEILSLVQVVLYVLGFGGLVYWLSRQIRALRGAVRAQEHTIKAQSEALKGFEGLLKVMQTILESTDEPKMLQRLKAYKEFVDTESEGLLKKQSRHFEEQKELITGEHNRRTFELIRALVDALAELFPYVPCDERTRLIDSIALPEPFNSEEVQESLHKLAKAAPAPPPRTLGEILGVTDAVEVKVFRAPPPIQQPPPPLTEPPS